MRWNARWPRLGVLLVCLAAALAALLGQRGLLWSSSNSAQANVPAGCDGRMSPATQLASDSALAQLRAAALAATPAGTAAPYEQGTVGPANLWSDNQPRPVAGGGYEARWWALNAEGRTDDVVVDVLRFANAGQAQASLLAAADPRCHRQATAGAGALPAGARELAWLNPDGAWQRDTLLARGPLLYRVSDAPPGLAASEAAQLAREAARAAAVTHALACLLPAAGCDRHTLAALAASVGSPAPAPSAAVGWPRTVAQASAYVRAVQLRPYDLPYMTALPRSGRAGAAPAVTPSARCAHAAPAVGGLAVGASSPLFAMRPGRWRQSAWSRAALLGRDGAAADYMRALSRALAGACARRVLATDLARIGGPRVRFADLHLTPLTPAAPESHRGRWAYRPVDERISVAVLLSTRRGRPLRRLLFIEIFAFAYRNAVVELEVTSKEAPLADANRRYLQSALVGRAEARWGR